MRLAAIPVLLGLVSVTLAACSWPERRQLRQRIEIGPFTIRVENASATVVTDRTGGGRWRAIDVRLRVVDDDSRRKIDFGSFLNNLSGFEEESRSLVSPHHKLVDDHGHQFLTTVQPDGTQWQARYDIRSLNLNADRAEGFNAEHLDLRARDFRLVIDNPDRRQGQAGAVSVKLR